MTAAGVISYIAIYIERELILCKKHDHWGLRCCIVLYCICKPFACVVRSRQQREMILLNGPAKLRYVKRKGCAHS